MVVLHAFLALLSGFATMAALVAVITVLLQKLTPGWVGETAKAKSSLYFRQPWILISGRSCRGLRHRVGCPAQSAHSCSCPGDRRAASCSAQRPATTRSATHLVCADAGGNYAAGRVGGRLRSIACPGHPLMLGVASHEREKPPCRCSLDRAARCFIQSFEELLLEAQPERSRDNLGIRADGRGAQAIGLGCDGRR